MNQEELINRIRQVIAALEQERGKLEQNSQAYKAIEKNLGVLTSNLNILTTAVNTQGKEFQTATASMAKYFEAFDKGQKRVRLGPQGRVPLGTTRQATDPNNIRPEDVDAAIAKISANAGRNIAQNAPDLPEADLTKNKTISLAYKNLADADKKTIDSANKTTVDAMRRYIRDVEQEAKANFTMRQRIAEQEAKQAEELHRIERNRNIGNALPGGQAAAQNLYKKAAQVDANFTPETLRRVDESSGVSRAKFSYTTDEGVVKSATFTVDRFGKVLVDTQKRFRTFTSAISRDIAEVLKWSIAVAAIYGPMQKFGELMQTMVENETALAEVSVTLGNAQQDMNEIFAAATDIAQTVGEETNNVLKAYNLAYRATGNISDSTERFATANKLLTDSLTLSKLAGIEEAQAIDLLSAALKQTNTPLDQGTQLINKWIAVTKTANVDLNTLATGFATLGDAAEAAGLSQDQLNAVLATVAETSNQSGQEVANTARALVAGFQSDQAQAMMRSLGISIEDASGQARGFLDLMGQISQLRISGQITDDQFSKLTLALGGGTRRQAAFATFIENFQKIDDITKASMGAGNESADALAKRLDTVQTASTRLGNAFQSLAQSVGESGGLLDIFKGFLNILTSITTALADVTNAVGKSGPTLAAVAGAMLLIKSQGPDFQRQMQEGMTGAFVRAGTWGKPGMLTQAMFGSGYKEGASGSSQIFTRGARFAQYAPSALGIAAGVGIPALENFSKGENAKGIGNVVGGAIVGTMGGLLAGPQGAVMGAAVGSAIAEGFVSAAQEYASAGSFDNLLKPIGKTTPKEPITPEQKRKAQEESTFDYIRKITGMDKGLGAFFGSVNKGIRSSAVQLSGGEALTNEQAALLELESQKRRGKVSEQEYARAIEMLRELNAPKQQATESGKQVEILFKDLIDTAQTQQENKMLEELNKLELGKAAFERGSTNLQGFSTLAGQYYGAFGKESGMAPEKFFGTVANVDARASDENITRLNEMVQVISQQKTELDKLVPGTDAYNKKLQEINANAKIATDYLKGVNNQLLSQAKTLQQVDLSGLQMADTGKPVDKEYLASLARDRYKSILQANVDAGSMTQDEMDAKLADLETILVEYEGRFEELKNVPVEALNSVISSLKDQKKIIESESKKGIGFQTFDMPQSKLEGIINGPTYEGAAKMLQGLGYKLDEQTEIAITNEGHMTKYTKDWKIVQFLLQEILKTEQKQLDGMYNLPEGASFWVPAQAKQLEPTGGGLEALLREFIAAARKDNTDVVSKAESRKVAPLSVDKPVYLVEAEKKPVVANTEARMKGYSALDLAYTDTKATLGAKAEKPGMNNPFMWPTPGLTNNFMEQLLKFFSQPLSIPNTSIPPTTAGGSAANAGLGALQNLSQLFNNLSTKLQLSIDNRTTVMLDGRQIAMVVKNYLKNDFVRYSNGSGSSSVSIL